MTIFVFGSNTAGRHGKGAALEARRVWGAKYGIGEGLTGNAYAIPTKDDQLQTRSLALIQLSVQMFIDFATANPQLSFFVTAIGCGLAGYQPNDIAPMFKHAPSNCELPKGWRDWVTF